MNAYEIDDLCPVCDQPIVVVTSHTVRADGALLYVHGDCCPICSASENFRRSVPRNSDDARATVDA